MIWVKDPDPEIPDKPCGMGVKFTKVDRKTSEVISKIIEFKKLQSSSPATEKSSARDEEPSEDKDDPSESETPDGDQGAESQPPKDSVEDEEAEELEGGESPEVDASKASEELLEEEDADEQNLSLELDESEEDVPAQSQEVEPDGGLQGPASELSAEVERGPEGEAIQERLVEALMVDSEDRSDEDVAARESSSTPERRSSSPPHAEASGSPSPIPTIGEVTGWPPWMNEPIDVDGILGRAVGAKPVVGEVVETELGKLQPEGFDLSVTLEALVGTIAAAQRVIVAPRTIGREQPPSSADHGAQDPLARRAQSEPDTGSIRVGR